MILTQMKANGTVGMDIYFNVISKYPWYIAMYLQNIVQKYETAVLCYLTWATLDKCELMLATQPIYCAHWIMQTIFLLVKVPVSIHIHILSLWWKS